MSHQDRSWLLAQRIVVMDLVYPRGFSIQLNRRQLPNLPNGAISDRDISEMDSSGVVLDRVRFNSECIFSRRRSRKLTKLIKSVGSRRGGAASVATSTKLSQS